MAYIKSVRNHTPKVGEGTFVAETAVLIGDVTVGKDSSLWFLGRELAEEIFAMPTSFGGYQKIDTATFFG